MRGVDFSFAIDELLKQGSRIRRGYFNKSEALIYWEELWEMVKAVVDYEYEKITSQC